jgi:hypothetical protein
MFMETSDRICQSNVGSCFFGPLLVLYKDAGYNFAPEILGANLHPYIP